jgi:hypothetical protein
MVAPVVLLTTGSLLSNGLLTVYSAVNDRMREMTRERFEIRSGPQGELLSRIPAVNQERLAEIEIQLPLMLRRHRLLRHAVLLIYVAIGVLGMSIIVIAVAVVEDSEDFGRAALGLVLAGTIVMLAGLVAAGLSMARSADAITYAVERTRRLGLVVSLAAGAAGRRSGQPDRPVRHENDAEGADRADQDHPAVRRQPAIEGLERVRRPVRGNQVDDQREPRKRHVDRHHECEPLGRRAESNPGGGHHLNGRDEAYAGKEKHQADHHCGQWPGVRGQPRHHASFLLPLRRTLTPPALAECQVTCRDDRQPAEP